MAKESNQQDKVVKATQIAFELEQKIAGHIRLLSAKEGLTASDQIRKLIGLSYSFPKRPRLTMSLTSDDYEILAKRYKIQPNETLEIKRQIIKELIGCF
ncbi:MAG: hypothetical protein HON23_00990 [Rickettsiales bacterium]|nr:hypothetical protein [Rickettsiales bacterium]